MLTAVCKYEFKRLSYLRTARRASASAFDAMMDGSVAAILHHWRVMAWQPLVMRLNLVSLFVLRAELSDSYYIELIFYPI